MPVAESACRCGTSWQLVRRCRPRRSTDAGTGLEQTRTLLGSPRYGEAQLARLVVSSPRPLCRSTRRPRSSCSRRWLTPPARCFESPALPTLMRRPPGHSCRVGASVNSTTVCAALVLFCRRCRQLVHRHTSLFVSSLHRSAAGRAAIFVTASAAGCFDFVCPALRPLRCCCRRPGRSGAGAGRR